jgi:acyl-coenzyme A synthetase/AMP-(fatty) acid ligase
VAQVAMLREAFGIEGGGVDLPTFPPFALFDPALGLTSVIPDMDPTRPATADPRRLLDAIERFGVTQLFGSPALLEVLARHGEATGARLPGVRRVLSAGAPVPGALVARMRMMLAPEAQLWTPYGATECLPVAVIEGGELLTTRSATDSGAGTCVGRPVPGNRVRIIHIVDGPIAEWNTVAGPSATDEYFNRPQATALAKIREADGTVVHRMGDVGYLDDRGRLWFCGRMAQRVESADGTLHTEQVEPVFNTHPQVRRSALVGVGARGAQRPVLCVELHAGVGAGEHERIEAELLNLGQRHRHTAAIDTVLFHPHFPVDIRHNAKIGRERLAGWAAARLEGTRR